MSYITTNTALYKIIVQKIQIGGRLIHLNDDFVICPSNLVTREIELEQKENLVPMQKYNKNGIHLLMLEEMIDSINEDQTTTKASVFV